MCWMGQPWYRGHDTDAQLCCDARQRSMEATVMLVMVEVSDPITKETVPSAFFSSKAEAWKHNKQQCDNVHYAQFGKNKS